MSTISPTSPEPTTSCFYKQVSGHHSCNIILEKGGDNIELVGESTSLGVNLRFDLRVQIGTRNSAHLWYFHPLGETP